MRTIYLDGKYLKVNDRITEVFTPGVFKAKGVFETMLGLDGVVLDAALHLKRLRAGLKVLGIKAVSIKPSVLEGILCRNDLSSGRVRLMVWQAPPQTGQAGRQAHVMIVALPYKVPGKKTYRVCLIRTDRAANGRLADVKSLDYGLFAKAFSQARSKGFDEALLLNRQGFIFEASRANIFWVKNKVLYTPPLSCGCLNGITRQQVIRQAENFRIPVRESHLTLEILKEADAAFLTNSLTGIKPIEITSIKNISVRK